MICHGDLHPFNLLVDGGHTTVVDWTGALRAEAAYDVAFTSLLLANPPLGAPRPLGAVIGRVGRLLSRRFIAAYRETVPGNDLGSLDWYRGLHGTRLLIDGASHEAEHGTGHPFGALAPAAVGAIRSATGIAVAAPA